MEKSKGGLDSTPKSETPVHKKERTKTPEEKVKIPPLTIPKTIKKKESEIKKIATTPIKKPKSPKTPVLKKKSDSPLSSERKEQSSA
mmetsp:Transcript_19509/g.16705  ORF Transcript_19509/g.16705 Transcript_19509/m.16705 type:complete len:87 (+) Transcript_19509:403-663(+)